MPDLACELSNNLCLVNVCWADEVLPLKAEYQRSLSEMRRK
jgi:hypothetical protein